MPSFTVNYTVRSADGATIEQRGFVKNWSTGATQDEAAKLFKERLAQQMGVAIDRIETRLRVEK